MFNDYFSRVAGYGWWRVAIAPYLAQGKYRPDQPFYFREAVWVCPADTPETREITFQGRSAAFEQYSVGYGYNIKGTGWIYDNVQDLALIHIFTFHPSEYDHLNLVMKPSAQKV